MDYKQMTNPEIVAAVGKLEGEAKAEALADLGDRGEAVQAALNAQLEPDGARAAVLDRLGREKQISDSQAWTADGISPNSPLVTEAVAAKFTEASAPEAVIDTLVSDTAAKGEGDLLAAVGKDTSKTLSSDEAAAGAAEDSADTGKKLKGKLPDGFPGKAALEAADVTTYAQARKLRDGAGLTSVPGVGDATAAQIEEALKE